MSVEAAIQKTTQDRRRKPAGADRQGAAMTEPFIVDAHVHIGQTGVFFLGVFDPRANLSQVLLADIDDQLKRKILSDNARAVYNIKENSCYASI